MSTSSGTPRLQKGAVRSQQHRNEEAGAVRIFAEQQSVYFFRLRCANVTQCCCLRNQAALLRQ
jgi:hypothetical protein